MDQRRKNRCAVLVRLVSLAGHLRAAAASPCPLSRIPKEGPLRNGSDGGDRAYYCDRDRRLRRTFLNSSMR